MTSPRAGSTTKRALLLALVAGALAQAASAAAPGRPFEDSACKSGAQKIPGIVQAALYDLGGEGVAYHDTDGINHGSGELNCTVEVEAAGRYLVRALYSNDVNTVSFDVDGQPAGECRLPVATGHWHTWNYGAIGTVTFPKAGRQVLTFHYGKGNDFAFFSFERTASAHSATPSTR